MTRTAAHTVSVGSSAVTHAATKDAHGHYGVSCGAVHYRNSGRGALRVHPAGTAVTCQRCPAPVAAPVAEVAPEAPLTFMQKQRLRGRAR